MKVDGKVIKEIFAIAWSHQMSRMPARAQIKLFNKAILALLKQDLRVFLQSIEKILEDEHQPWLK
ncbi:hypothetical protein HK101_006913, partial [Irineochytrium annulatum]